MIHDLRVALFDKVQRMPVAFFTRTQTGALISRLNNDVIGAQDAVTGTLGSVVSNVIVLSHHAHHDAHPGVAPHACWRSSCCRCSSCRPSGSGGSCRRSPASAWTSTPR